MFSWKNAKNFLIEFRDLEKQVPHIISDLMHWIDTVTDQN